MPAPHAFDMETQLKILLDFFIVFREGKQIFVANARRRDEFRSHFVVDL